MAVAAVRPEKLLTHFSPQVTSEARAIVNGTAYEVRRSDEPREHQGLVFCGLFPCSRDCILPTLSSLTLPCRSPPYSSLHALNYLDPWDYAVLIACETGVKSIQLCQNSPRLDQSLIKQLAWVQGSHWLYRNGLTPTRTDLPPPERTRLHQNGLASKTLIYPQNTSHPPLRTVFAFLQKVFPSSTSEITHTPVQRLTFAQPTPT